MPARIAKGELEGKMKVRIWRKLHREEAARFDQAYALMDKHPGLGLPEAFGVVQSGLSVDEFLARRARVKKKEEVKVARTAVTGDEVAKFLVGLAEEKAELSLVLAERTFLDVLKQELKVALELEKSGRLEKLQVVALAKKSTWDAHGASLGRDAALSQKPAAVARQPARRPVSDPRPFQEHLGKPVKLVLRNGLLLEFPLRALGPFDLLVGPDEQAVFFVPLHAIVSWSAL